VFSGSIRAGVATTATTQPPEIAQLSSVARAHNRAFSVHTPFCVFFYNSILVLFETLCNQHLHRLALNRRRCAAAAAGMYTAGFSKSLAPQQQAF
jgi:hypothetical protein